MTAMPAAKAAVIRRIGLLGFAVVCSVCVRPPLEQVRKTRGWLGKDGAVPIATVHNRRRRPALLLAALSLAAAMSAIVPPLRPVAAADSLTIRGLSGLRVGEKPSFRVPAIGCSSVLVPGRRGVSVLIRDGRISVVEVRTPNIATLRGVAVGQAGDRVVAVYGREVVAENDGFIFVPQSTADASLRMAFEVSGGWITAIRAGDEADVRGDCAGGDLIRAAGVNETTITTAVSSAPSTLERIVVIDPGHNGANGAHARQINALVDAGGFTKACNTVGSTSLSGLTEAAFNWSVARKLGVLLKAGGWQVVFTRTDNAGWGPCVDQRGQRGAGPGVVALLSIHADGGPAKGRGFHVIWPKPLTGYTANTAKASSELATAVRDAMVASNFRPATYIGRNGLDNRGDLGTLNRSPVPSMMIESGNLRNVADDAELSSESGQQRVAAAVASGFEAWYAARS